MLHELFDQPSACRKEEPIKTPSASLSWNENLHTLSHDGTWLREALDSILRSARIDTSMLYSVMLEEMLVCSLSVTKGTSKPSCMSLFCFCLLIFLLFCPSISQILEDTLSWLSIHYINIYIKSFFKLLSFKFFISKGFHLRIAYLAEIATNVTALHHHSIWHIRNWIHCLKYYYKENNQLYLLQKNMLKLHFEKKKIYKWFGCYFLGNISVIPDMFFTV